MSESQISISNGRLEPLSKTRPAYKATTAASPKLTNMLLKEFRGKGDSFTIACESRSSALPLDVTNGMRTGQKVGTEFSSTSATVSSGKLGDKKGASSSASVKLVKTY